MNVAVLSLTRDRIDYTTHCFNTLAEHAGCDYDHFVLDNGSTDGTADWLRITYKPETLILLPDNIGVAPGINQLLDSFNPVDYDVIVKFDNDCELTQPKTLRDICDLVEDRECILSPRILGLNNPPQPTRELSLGDGEIMLDVPQIGGIFLAAPAWVYDTYRYPDGLPVWGGDDTHICAWFRQQGGTCGYVKRFEAWHYRSTDGQHQDHPAYFERRVLEGGPV